MELTSSSALNRELADWYSAIRNGHLRLPRFQRMEAWDRVRVQSFLQTIIHNLPVGVTLVLNVGDEEKFVSRCIKTAEDNDHNKITEHLLDGQQRLTAFWRALHNNYEHETFYVYLPAFDESNFGDANDEKEVFYRSRYLKKGVKYPLWADNPRSCLVRGLIPMQLFRPEEIQSEIDVWIEEASKDSKPDPTNENFPKEIEQYYNKREQLKQQIIKIRETVAHYNLPYLSLPYTTPKDIALHVFINMNTNSKPLSIYDIIVAEVEIEIKKSLHDLRNDLDTKYPRVKKYYDLDSLLLTTSALLQDKTPSHKGMAEMSKAVMVENWGLLEESLGRMANLMESLGVFDKERLPTNAVLSVVAALYSIIPKNGDLAGKWEILLRKYIWSSFFTYRYEHSASSRAFQDFISLKRIITNQKHADDSAYIENDVPVLNRKLYPLVTKEEILEAGWPKKVGIIARSVMAITTYLGANDFADGKKISINNINEREYHHIFPAALLEEAEIVGTTAVNCALITGKTNKVLGRKEPLNYLKERYKWADVNVVKNRLSTHLIPINELENGGYEGLNKDDRIEKIRTDFQTFQEERAKLIARAANALSKGEHITPESVYSIALSEPLKELDKHIGQIEILIRDLVDEKLGRIDEDPFDKFVPEITKTQAIRKIEQRLKKYPNESMDDYLSFRKKMNFLTLGEFQALICWKKNWPHFEPLFKNSHQLSVRFTQLSTLRNQIAHNNEIDEIMRKDGEAAILWFKNIFKPKYTKDL